MFRGFGAVFYKEALHVRRDFTAMFFALIMPLLQMVLLGFGIDTNIRQINTVVLNADGRQESRELLDRLKNSDMFHIEKYVQTDQQLNDEIIAGRARVGIKIPVDYSDRLIHQMGAQVLVLIDGSDSSVAGQAINVTTAIGLDESLRRALVSSNNFAVEMRPKLLFNPDSRSPNFFLPGLTAILLLNVTTFLTAFSIVREKERGTLETTFVTPVRPMGLLLGKLLPYLVIGFFELCLIVSFMRFVFRVPIHGNPLLLALFSLPYLFVSLSLGILISSKANTQLEAMQLAFLTILPSIFFSGYIFPQRNHAVRLSHSQLFRSCRVFHQHHARHHPARRGNHPPVDGRARASRDGHFFYSSSPRAASRTKSSWRKRRCDFAFSQAQSILPTCLLGQGERFCLVQFVKKEKKNAFARQRVKKSARSAVARSAKSRLTAPWTAPTSPPRTATKISTSAKFLRTRRSSKSAFPVAPFTPISR